MAPVLSAIELTKRFGDVTAVGDLSFDIDAGSVTGFLGPNWAGKTTTLRMLLGLAEPTHGRALVFGRPFAELEQWRPRSSWRGRWCSCWRRPCEPIEATSRWNR